MEIRLIATTGRAKGQAVEIRAAKFFIGRHANCQLQPDIVGLAGIHALIEERENRRYLRDFGAEGGTGINDRVLHARELEVFDGDLIQIGPMVLTLSVQSKGQGPRQALTHPPDGWPFLEGVENQGEPALSASAPAAVATKPRPVSASVSVSVSVSERSPARPEPFLAVHPSIRPDLAVARAPAPAVVPLHFEPIVTRPHNRQAIDCRMVGDVMVVSLLSPDLQQEETVSPIRYELRSLLEEELVPGRMVIDMGNTRYLSSRAVGVILAHYQGLERVGSTMRVCGVSKEIKPVLDQMRLSMLIDIYPSVEEAVQDSWD